jgi:hypothetical protein
VVSAAVAAFAWRTVDAELAELAYDSAVDAGLALRSSAGDGVRALSFTAGEATVELELADGEVLGQLLPPGPAEVVLQRLDEAGRPGEAPGGAECALRASDAGFFAAPVPGGRAFRLWCRRPGGGWLVTDWTRC